MRYEIGTKGLVSSKIGIQETVFWPLNAKIGIQALSVEFGIQGFVSSKIGIQGTAFRSLNAKIGNQARSLSASSGVGTSSISNSRMNPRRWGGLPAFCPTTIIITH